MNLNLRLTTKEDYPELVDWWHWHKWKIPPTIELLDNLRFGLMVSHKDENICAGFVYFTNANEFSVVEFIISTYKVKDKEIRKQSIQLLIESLSGLAEKKGVKVIFTHLKNEHLIKHHTNCGYINNGNGLTEMIKIL